MVIRGGGPWLGMILLVSHAAAGETRALDQAPTSAATGSAAETTDRVRAALGGGSFPWYDPRADSIRPLQLPRPRNLINGRWSSGRIGWAWGDFLVFGCFVAALLALGGLVAWFWRRFEPGVAEGGAGELRSSTIQSAGDVLPAGLRTPTATDDLWAEAERCRRAGDYAGAVRCLFAHQLLTLARLGLVRLAPGRTGRQLHRSVADRELQTLMTPTLRQFEAVYYGQRNPTAAEFAPVWTAAETFQRRVAEQVNS